MILRGLMTMWALARNCTGSWDCWTGADGAVSRPPIRKTGPLETVTLAVADAMRDWRFAPAEQGGEPVACDTRLTFDLRFDR
jgi:outer membrane biosynthesis protein TonB